MSPKESHVYMRTLSPNYKYNQQNSRLQFQIRSEITSFQFTTGHLGPIVLDFGCNLLWS